MESIVNMFVTVFGLLFENKVFNIPVLIWLMLPAVVGICIKFIEGRK